MNDESTTGGVSNEEPEGVVWVRWFYTHIKTNWRLLRKPAVIVSIALAAVLGWYVGKSFAAEELSVRAERISYLQDQVNGYKSKLQVASPDEAASHLSSVELQLDAANKKLAILMPDKARSLSDEQKLFIKNHKDDFARILGGSFPMYAWTVGDAQAYAYDFASAFGEFLPSSPSLSTALCASDQKGVMVGVPDLTSISPAAMTFHNLLLQMNVPNTFTFWARPKMFQSSFEFDLFVCG